MREFLKDIRIVGATLAFREGEFIRYCLDDMFTNCDHVLIVLDNHDKKTERVVMDYKKMYPGKCTVACSGVKRLDDWESRRAGILKKRLNRYQASIRESVLRELKILHESQPIDLCMFYDADEVFTNYLDVALTDFWNSDKSLMFVRPVTVFDNFKILRKQTLIPHGKIFKYRPDVNCRPYRARGFYRPFEKEDITTEYYIQVHLPLLNKEIRNYRKQYTGGSRIKRASNDKLWQIDKDVRLLSPKEIRQIFKKPHSFTVDEYLTKTYGTTLSQES